MDQKVSFAHFCPDTQRILICNLRLFYAIFRHFYDLILATCANLDTLTVLEVQVRTHFTRFEQFCQPVSGISCSVLPSTAS